MSVEVVTALCHPPSHRGQFSPPHWGHPHSLHLGSPGSEGENHSGHLCLAGVPMAASKSTWGDTPLACVKPQPAEGPPLLPAPTQAMADAAGAGAESALQSVPPPSCSWRGKKPARNTFPPVRAPTAGLVPSSFSLQGR